MHQLVVEDGITDMSGDTEVNGILDRIKASQQNIEDREEELRREDAEPAEKKAS